MQLKESFYRLFLQDILTLIEKKIIWVIGVLRRTVVSDWRFDNLCGNHLQSKVVVLVSWKFKNPGEWLDWSVDRVNYYWNLKWTQKATDNMTQRKLKNDKLTKMSICSVSREFRKFKKLAKKKQKQSKMKKRKSLKA